MHRSPRRRLIDWVSVILIAVAVSFTVRTYALQAFFIPSGSMQPTLMVGDRILVDKLFFSAASVKRGAIVVFHHPPADLSCGEAGQDLVKRVIATQGQQIWSVNGRIFIDGRPITEPYLPANDALGPAIVRQTIPRGEVFLMGDNRTNSCDSRFWGPIPTSLIVGKVVAIWWHNSHPFLHLF